MPTKIAAAAFAESMLEESPALSEQKLRKKALAERDQRLEETAELFSKAARTILRDYVLPLQQGGIKMTMTALAAHGFGKDLSSLSKCKEADLGPCLFEYDPEETQPESFIYNLGELKAKTIYPDAPNLSPTEDIMRESSMLMILRLEMPEKYEPYNQTGGPDTSRLNPSIFLMNDGKTDGITAAICFYGVSVHANNFKQDDHVTEAIKELGPPTLVSFELGRNAENKEFTSEYEQAIRRWFDKVIEKHPAFETVLENMADSGSEANLEPGLA